MPKTSVVSTKQSTYAKSNSAHLQLLQVYPLLIDRKEERDETKLLRDIALVFIVSFMPWKLRLSEKEAEVWRHQTQERAN